MTDFSILLGKTLDEIHVDRGDPNSIIFVASDGSKFRQYHDQDCCESVDIEEIVGDLQDMMGHPLLIAEESTNDDPSPSDESGTWTFYKLATVKGHATIRWYGSSNGYYSESVYFEQTQEATAP